MTVIQKKIVLMGNFGVGKTSIARRFVEGMFDDQYLSTIGVQIYRKAINRGDYQLNLILWDVAGGDDFIEYPPNHLRGAEGAILVCDLTRRETLDCLPRYLEQLHDVSSSEPAVLMIGNKGDLESQFEFGMEDLQTISEDAGCPFVVTSARTGECIDDAFITLAELIDS